MNNIHFHLTVAKLLANFMDNSLVFLGRRFGVSALIGLVPGIGDVVDAVIAFYFVWIGKKMNMPEKQISKMYGNIALAFLMGLFPIIGDAGYLLYRPSLRNFRILKKYAEQNIQEAEVVQKHLALR